MLVAARHGHAEDWRDGVTQAAGLLVDVGAVTEGYGRRCLASADELGPYFVLAKGVALAHARPDDDCLAPGLSLARLAEPVEFGHAKNDPVDLVFCLASPDDSGHVQALKAFAKAMGGGLATRLRESAPERLTEILREAVNPR